MVSLLARTDDPRVNTVIFLLCGVLLLAPAAAFTMLGEISYYNRHTDRWFLITRQLNPIQFTLILIALYSLGTLMLTASIVFYFLYF